MLFKKNLWSLFMDGVQPSQCYRATQLIDLGRTKGWDDLGVTLWFLTWDPWFGNPSALTTRPWLQRFLLYELYRCSQDPTNIKPSVIRQKGDNQNECFKKKNHAKFSEKLTFLIPWYAHVCTCADGKFVVLCFLDYLPFALLLTKHPTAFLDSLELKTFKLWFKIF